MLFGMEYVNSSYRCAPHCVEVSSSPDMMPCTCHRTLIRMVDRFGDRFRLLGGRSGLLEDRCSCSGSECDHGRGLYNGVKSFSEEPATVAQFTGLRKPPDGSLYSSSDPFARPPARKAGAVAAKE